MKNKRAGFSIVEVACAMAIVAIISGVVIAVIASSRDIMDISQSWIDASAEAQSVIGCYIAAEKEPSGLAKQAQFIEKLGLFYDKDKSEMVKYDAGIQDNAPVYRHEPSTNEAKYEKYTFYYNGKFELLNVPESNAEKPNPDRAGGYRFRLVLTVYETNSDDGNGMTVEVIEFAPDVRKEKTVYEYGK